MSVAMISLLVILLLFGLFFIGLEIGFAMAIAGFIGFALIINVDAAFSLVAKDIFSVFSSYGFTVIPMFVLMGQVGASGGVARSLYDSAYKFMGHIPGGLAIGTVVAATAFKAICGSSPATAATFATIAVPEMDRYGYDKRLSCGTVATVGTLGILIPPSVVLIVYGILTETSIGKLFLAGIIPGLMLAFSFILTLVGWSMINPKLGPKGEKSTWAARIASLPAVLVVGAIFFIVVGGLMEGFFTPTEAGSVGTLAVLLLTLAKKDMNLKKFIKGLQETLRIACMVLMLIAGATILGHFFAVTRTPFMVASWLEGLQLDRNIIMLIIIAVYLIGRILHRGPCLPDPGDADFSACCAQNGVRPHLVWCDCLCDNHDRYYFAACGHQRFCGFRGHQGACRNSLQGCLPLFDRYGYMPFYSTVFPGDFPVGAPDIHEIMSLLKSDSIQEYS